MKYTVNRASGQSAYIQIYRQLRDDIVAGRLKDGAKLPSKRFAAAELGVSVITVEHAYELLEEEGYIQSRQRSGYYVCFGGSAPALPRTAPQEQRADAPRDFPFSVLARTMRRVLSDSGERLPDHVVRGRRRPPHHRGDRRREGRCGYLFEHERDCGLERRGAAAQPRIPGRFLLMGGQTHV